MYHPAPVPQPPYRGGRSGRVAVRVVLFVVSVGSVGFLSWVPPLVLAVRYRRVRDWLWFVAAAALCCLACGLVAVSRSDDDWPINAGVALLLLLSVVLPAHYLVADIRRTPRGFAPPGRGPFPAPGTNPYAVPAPYPVAAPVVPMPPRQGPAPHVPPPHVPPPARSDRIDQVRAELDELSAYLRDQEPRG